MVPVKLRGMTWDHRRAIDPLTHTMPLFQQRHPDIDIEWSARPLAGFEFTSVDALAEDYDLIILDHPFMGAVAASGSLAPLNEIDGLSREQFVGPSLDTYRMKGSLWALPVDAACQVAVSRPDLMSTLGSEAPKSWTELIALGAKARRKSMRLAIGLAGVHSLMTFFTLMANLGTPCATAQEEPFADRHTARAVFGLMRELLEFCPPEVFGWNSIRLHDEMVARDDLVFCPAVYCYATYAEADQRRPLRFHDLPGPTGPSGSTIGGTGLAISAKCKHRQAAFDYAALRGGTRHPARLRRTSWPAGAPGALARRSDQRAFRRLLPRHAGNDGRLLDTATLRRLSGLSGEGRRTVEAHLRGDVSEDALLSQLERLHAGR